MNTERKPQPGDMGFSTIGGIVGFWVGLGQYINRDGSRWSHVFVVLDDETVMEAMPKGAQIVPLSDYKDKAVYINWGLTKEQRTTVVAEARKLEGTPYNFLDYLALALARFNIKPKWLVEYIKSSKSLICSALADMVYNHAGVKLFEDGRLWHDVTPGDLTNLFIEKYGLGLPNRDQ